MVEVCGLRCLTTQDVERMRTNLYVINRVLAELEESTENKDDLAKISDARLSEALIRHDLKRTES